MDNRVPEVDLKRFADRTYTTFVSRARAAQRLATRGILWSIALAVSSTATLAISVVSLSKPDYLSGKANLFTCLFSILTLVLSLIAALFNYGGRARDMFHSYRTIQRVSARAERLELQTISTESKAAILDELDTEYQLGLDQSENHTTLDYYRAKKIDRMSPQDAQAEDLKNRRRAVALQIIVDAVPVTIIVGAALLTAGILLSL